MGIFWGLDWTYLLILPALLFSVLVQGTMQSTFDRYLKVRGYAGMTGAQAAQKILMSEGIYDVQIRHIRGKLNDHYDPRTRTLSLSDPVYLGMSVAALAVAAHECGHAIQDAKNYAPLRIRSTLVPLASFGSGISWWIFLAGLIFSFQPLLKAGILFFLFALAFQLVTLPVEFNASSRALKKLHETGIMIPDELKGTKKVLRAAAMTYVAATAASVAQLLRMLLLAQSRNRD